MSNLGSLLREHYEEIAPPIDVDRLADRLLTSERLQPTPPRSRGVLVAVAAALMVLLVIGGTTLFIQLNQGVEVIEEPPITTTVPSTTVPEEPPPDAGPGPDESVVVALGAEGLPFTVLDRAGDVGAGASVIVTSDGVPMVAYTFHPIEDGVASEIRLATCADADCLASGTVATIAEIHEPPEPPGEGAPVLVEIQALLPNDGLPIVVWSEWDDAADGGESNLKAYKCADPSCSSGALTEIDTLEHSSGLWVAAASDNTPLIARRVGDWEHTTIHLTKCVDPACAGESVTSVVDIPRFGWGLAVTMGEGDLPVIAVQLKGEDEGTSSLGVARCTDPLCREQPTVADLGVPISEMEMSALALDGSGNPVILAASHSPEGGGGQMVLVACTEPTCTDDPIITVIAEPQTGGDFNPFGSLAVGEDSTVTTLNTYSGEIHVVTCADPTCADGALDVPVLPDLGWAEYDLAMTPDGAPVVAIHTNTDLGVFVCADSTCATSQVSPLPDTPGSDWAATIAAVADVQFSGTNPSIEIGPGGYPVIAYLGFGTDQGPEGENVAGPKLLVCGDTGCTSSTTQVINDESAWVSMVVRPNGLPAVVYSDWTDDWSTDQLFVAWCADPGCTTWTTEKIDETDWFNSAVEIASRSDGSVAVVYQKNYYVNLVSCGGGTCEGAEPVRIESLVDPNDNEWGMRWWMNSLDLAMLPDGRPVIAAAQSNGELRYVECLDAACTDSQRITIDQTLDDMTAAVAVGPSGLPILAHYDDGELTVTACHDSGCQDTTVTAIGEATAGTTGSVRPSIAFGDGGNPMIAYWAPRALMLAECHNPMCTDATVEVFASVRTHDLAILPNGSPVMTYFAYSEEEPPPGEEEFGPLVDLRVAECTSGTCVGG
jgi:hypothetical protein